MDTFFHSRPREGYFVELIDLTLSLKAKGHQSDYVGFHAETKVLCLDEGRVGKSRIQERIVGHCTNLLAVP